MFSEIDFFYFLISIFKFQYFDKQQRRKRRRKMFLQLRNFTSNSDCILTIKNKKNKNNALNFIAFFKKIKHFK